MSHNKRYRNDLELFLDDGFSNLETAAMLRSGGFTVHEFVEVFPDGDFPERREQFVVDPSIIEICSKNRWLMVTTDKDMCQRHRAIIRRNRHTMILATAHNGKCMPAEWVTGLITLKDELKEMLQYRERPWFAFFCRDGRLTGFRKHSWF